MENKPIVIAFLGRLGTGKTTAAQYLEKNYAAKVFSFATPLKQLSKILWGFSDQQVYGSQQDKEEIDARIGLSPRNCLQRLGQGARDIIGEGVWVDACLNQIQCQHAVDMYENLTQSPLYVIDDMRYPSEARAVRGYPQGRGVVVKLCCPTAQVSDHSSETSVDEVSSHLVDYTIDNDASMEVFEREISRILTEVINQ